MTISIFLIKTIENENFECFDLGVSTKGAASTSTAFWSCMMGCGFLELKVRKRWVVLGFELVFGDWILLKFYRPFAFAPLVLVLGWSLSPGFTQG
jgi:hypothetical protein